jgi:hypothetical protein
VGYLACGWLLLIAFCSFPGRFLITVWLVALCCGLCDYTNASCCGICGGICCGHFCDIVCGILDQLLVAFWLRSGCFLVAFWWFAICCCGSCVPTSAIRRGIFSEMFGGVCRGIC